MTAASSGVAMATTPSTPATAAATCCTAARATTQSTAAPAATGSTAASAPTRSPAKTATTCSSPSLTTARSTTSTAAPATTTSRGSAPTSTTTWSTASSSRRSSSARKSLLAPRVPSEARLTGGPRPLSVAVWDSAVRLSFDALEERAYQLEVKLRLLEVRHVVAVLQEPPFRPRERLVQWLHQGRRALVVAARRDQRRHADLAEPVDHVPVLERPGDGELVRPPHRLVDLLPELLARAFEHFRLRVEPADVVAVELVLLLLDAYPGPQVVVQPPRLLRPARCARRRRVEHEAREPVRLRERVFEREHAAPRRAEEVDPLEPEPFADRPELIDERPDRPERRIVRPVGLPAAKLVVGDDAPPLLGERAQPF